MHPPPHYRVSEVIVNCVYFHTIVKDVKNYVKVVEVCFNRKMMRASQTDRNSNEHILTDVNLQEEFVTLMRIRQSTLCMHIIGRGALQCVSTTGKLEGKRDNGRQSEIVLDMLAYWYRESL